VKEACNNFTEVKIPLISLVEKKKDLSPECKKDHIIECDPEKLFE
jgi:hypothetical protein